MKGVWAEQTPRGKPEGQESANPGPCSRPMTSPLSGQCPSLRFGHLKETAPGGWVWWGFHATRHYQNSHHLAPLNTTNPKTRKRPAPDDPISAIARSTNCEPSHPQWCTRPASQRAPQPRQTPRARVSLNRVALAHRAPSTPGSLFLCPRRTMNRYRAAADPGGAQP
jgi:hypothetical protein